MKVRSFQVICVLSVLLFELACSTSQQNSASNESVNNITNRGCPELSNQPRPKPLVIVEPEFTELAKLKKLHGVVYVEAKIDEHGKVTEARVVRGLSPDYGMNRACVTAALQCTYTPGMRNGVAVSTLYTYQVVLKTK